MERERSETRQPNKLATRRHYLTINKHNARKDPGKIEALFELPLAANQKHLHKSGFKKRKREAKRGVSQEPPETHDERASQPPPSSQESVVVTPLERSQRLLAAKDITVEPPEYPFPHKGYPGEDSTYAAIAPDTFTLPHLAAIRSEKKQRVSALTTLLHRCLTKHDWPRAKRALGLLLREELWSGEIELRNGELWGIAAEILMHTGPAVIPDETADNDGREPDFTALPGPARPPTWYSQRVFEETKKFYNTIILRYPFTRRGSQTRNAVDFYHALFSLWIYVIQDQATNYSSLTARKVAEASRKDTEASRTNTKASRTNTRASRKKTRASRSAAEEEELQEEEKEAEGAEEGTEAEQEEAEENRFIIFKLHILQQAVELSNAITAARSGYPFRDDMHLIRLQAMVLVWLADLIDGNTKYAEGLGDDEKGEELRSKIESHTSEIAIPSDAQEDDGETIGRSTELRAAARRLFDRLEARQEDDLDE